MKKFLLYPILLLILLGCSSSATMDSGSTDSYYSNEITSEPSYSDSILLENKKIIYTASLYIETTNFDDSIDSLQEAVDKYDGYVSNSSISKYTYDQKEMRNAEYTVRIPSDSFDQFLSGADSFGNVTSRNTNTDDITDAYEDVEARLKSLRTEEETLLELLKKAESVEDIITIQSSLSDVRYQIESYEAQQKNYDKEIAYSTFNISLNEVQSLTPTATSFMDTIKNAFSESFTDFQLFLQEALIFLIHALPFLLFIAIIVFLILFIRKKYTSKKANPSK